MVSIHEHTLSILRVRMTPRYSILVAFQFKLYFNYMCLGGWELNVKMCVLVRFSLYPEQRPNVSSWLISMGMHVSGSSK